MGIDLIVVNDGSTKNIENEKIAYLKQNIEHFTFVNNPINKGKGYAVKMGLLQSKADCYIFTDIDFPYLEVDVVNMYHNLIENQSDIVIGIRSEQYYNEVPSTRKRISLWYKSLIKFTLKIPTSDTQAGLKALSKKGKEQLLACYTNGYLFDLELVKRAAQKNLKITQTHIQVKPEIILSKMPFKTLLKELGSFLKIMFSKY